MGLEQALGFPTVEDTVMHGPRIPFTEGFVDPAAGSVACR